MTRHSTVVRVTHWIHTFSFFGLLVSGIAILVAHPRLYWGETGTIGTPALLELPIPFVFGHSGWGRYLHFLSAWFAVLSGVVYGLWGLFDHHFHRDLLPSTLALSWRSIRRAVLEADPRSYNPVQRLVYLAVVFLLFPLAILTGLAMSPALTSVVPALVVVFGGQQSARTIHFFVACALALFLVVHVVMISLGGFAERVGAMITGRSVASLKPS